ncbi:hypothetical protein KC866_00445 [Patescibacteria group bacterium]|nr:hypothetical protein [Patescibacteria group bacterium]
MNTQNTERGIGVFAVILIIAIIGLGGYAVYNTQVKKKATLEVEMEQMDADDMLDTVDDIQADVVATFAEVKANLALKTEAGIKTATSLLAALEARIDAQSATLSTAAQDQTQVFKRRIQGARAKVSAATTETLAEAEAEIDAIEADIEESFDAIEATIEVEDDGMMMDDDASDDVDEDDSMMMDDHDDTMMGDDDSTMMEDTTSDDGLNDDGMIDGSVDTSSDTDVMVDDESGAGATTETDVNVVIE